MGRVLVVGSGVAGIQASLDLADFGYHVSLVEREHELGGNLKNLSELFPTGENASDLLSSLLSKIAEKKNVTVMKSSEVLDIAGEFPEFKAKVKNSKEEMSLKVNAIILATGFKPYDPSRLRQYGYGKYKDVITSLELEEMLKKGRLVRPSDLKKLGSISIIQCVGSRDNNTNLYCSSFCCMYAIKLAQRIKKMYPEMMITILYMDIRTPYEGEFDYNNARLLGVRFLRGKPARVRKVKDILVFQVEDTLENDLVFLESDIVVLSIGGVPDPTTVFFKDNLKLELSDTGFIHTVERPVGTNVKGVFVAGAASGLKDIANSMTQGSCAAAKVDIILKSAGIA
jgi:heterodisulfide reductase subunit A-like polyferredoxin